MNSIRPNPVFPWVSANIRPRQPGRIVVPRIVQPYVAGGSPRLFQNLNPAAAIPVEKNQVFKLRSFYDHHYRLNRGEERGQYVPNSRYIFVTTTDGETLLHPRFRHPAIAAGRPVLYAGEAKFENGKLEWWSNASGNYRPDAHHAGQAGLPMDSFYTWEDIMRGKQDRPENKYGLPGGRQSR